MNHQKKRTLLLIGCGVMAEPYLEAAKRAGFDVAIVETSTRLNALKETGTVPVDEESVLPVLGDTDEAWVGPAVAIAHRLKPNAIIAFSERQVIAGNAAQTALKLPGPGSHASFTSRNKAIQRAVLRDEFIGHPSAAVMSPLSTAKHDAPAPSVVVKALTDSGSHGVELFSGDAKEWAQLVDRRASETVLVEEYIDAQEYSWEGLIQRGQVIRWNLTRKTTTNAPNFVELMHEVAFEQVDNELGLKARAFGGAVLSSLGMRDGIISVEFRAQPGRPLILMEAMVRTPGDFLINAISNAQNFDWFEGHIRIAAGEDVKPQENEPGFGSAVLYFVAPREGTLDSFDAASLRCIDGVDDARGRFVDGTRVRPPQSSADRIGWALLRRTPRGDIAGLVDTVRSAGAASIRLV